MWIINNKWCVFFEIMARGDKPFAKENPSTCHSRGSTRVDQRASAHIFVTNIAHSAIWCHANKATQKHTFDALRRVDAAICFVSGTCTKRIPLRVHCKCWPHWSGTIAYRHIMLTYHTLHRAHHIYTILKQSVCSMCFLRQNQIRCYYYNNYYFYYVLCCYALCG